MIINSFSHLINFLHFFPLFYVSFFYVLFFIFFPFFYLRFWYLMFSFKNAAVILFFFRFFVQLSMFNVQCSVFSVQCSVFSVQCSVFNVQCSVASRRILIKNVSISSNSSELIQKNVEPYENFLEKKNSSCGKEGTKKSVLEWLSSGVEMSLEEAVRWHTTENVACWSRTVKR